MNIRQLQKDSFRIANAHGFWEDVKTNETTHVVSTKLMLIVSELSEALEEIRNDNWLTYETKDGKLHGVPVELADVLIRVADLAEWLGIDLEVEAQNKQRFNESRPYKHGKKI